MPVPVAAITDIWNLALLYAGVNQRVGSVTERSAAAQACSTAYETIRRQVLSQFRWKFAIKREPLVPLSGVAWDAGTTYGVLALAQYGSVLYRSKLAGNLNHDPTLAASAAWWAQVTRDGYLYVCPLPVDLLEPIAVWERPSPSQTSLPPVFVFTQDTSGYSLRNPRASGRVPYALENANDGSDLQVLLSDLDSPMFQYVADVQNPVAFPPSFTDTLAWHLAVPLAMSLRGDEKKAAACATRAKIAMAESFAQVHRGSQEDEEPVSDFEAAREGMP